MVSSLRIDFLRRYHLATTESNSVSTIATVANYEYCFYWNFYQDGTIELETRLTGILNVYTAAEGEVAPFGTLVAPQVQAQYHQHIFSLRLDPMVDGLRNSVVESDILPVNAPTGSVANFAGNGFCQTKTVLRSPQEHGARLYDAETDRRWTIVNTSRTHYASGYPVGYSLGVRGATIKLLARPDSWIAQRAVFASKTLWVVRDDGAGKRFFPAGKYVPQTSVFSFWLNSFFHYDVCFSLFTWMTSKSPSGSDVVVRRCFFLYYPLPICVAKFSTLIHALCFSDHCVDNGNSIVCVQTRFASGCGSRMGQRPRQSGQ